MMLKTSITCRSFSPMIKPPNKNKGNDRNNSVHDRTKMAFPKGWQPQNDGRVLKRVSQNYPDVRRGLFPNLEVVAEVVEDDNQNQSVSYDDSEDEGIFMKCPSRQAKHSENGQAKQTNEEMPGQSAAAVTSAHGIIPFKQPHVIGHPTPPDSNVDQQRVADSMHAKTVIQGIVLTGLISPPATPVVRPSQHPENLLAFDNTPFSTASTNTFQTCPDRLFTAAIQTGARPNYSNESQVVDTELLNDVHLPASVEKDLEEAWQQNLVFGHDHAEEQTASPVTESSNHSSATQVDNQQQGTLIHHCVHQSVPASTPIDTPEELPSSAIQRGFDCPPENYIKDHFTLSNRRRRMEIVDSWTAWPAIEGFNWHSKQN